MRLPPPIRYEELQRETMSAPLLSHGMTSMHCGWLQQEPGIRALTLSSSLLCSGIEAGDIRGTPFRLHKAPQSEFCPLS